MRHGILCRRVGLISIFLVALAGGLASAQHGGAHPGGLSGGPHQHLDARFSHNQYYYNRGYSVRRPPAGAFGEFHGSDGGRYWFHGGHWYHWRGGAWVVWGAPVGLFLPVLPLYFTTVWWNGLPYYYANDTYYVWDDDHQAYEVVAPPDGMESGGSVQAPPETQSPPSTELYLYPKSGQSAEQQARDRYECHRWAVGQTGFDPTVSGSSAAPEQRMAYRNAQMACLQGRGYSVK